MSDLQKVNIAAAATVSVLWVFIALMAYDPHKEVTSRHTGIIAYHFYDGGRTAIGLKGRITTIVDPPSVYGFEIDGHAVQTNKTAWYTSVDGQRIGYVEIKSSKSIEYSTSSVK